MIRILLFLFLLPSLANATTYYVRDDGGTSTQCTGQADAAYDGAGTGEACAYIHPAWALGGPSTSGTLAAGDTLIIDNVSHSGGGQAKYLIGYSMPNATCSTSFPYDCYLDTIPAGVDADHKTKIYGKGYADCNSKNVTEVAQLWGRERVSKVLTYDSNVEIQCLEITDHSGCIENGPSDGTLPGGDPVKCERSTYPYGEWAQTGISSARWAQNIVLKNLFIHGLATRGLYGTNLGDIDATNVRITGNGFVGWDSDNQNICTTNSRTITAGCTAHNDAGCGTTSCECGILSTNCSACTSDVANDCAWNKDSYYGTVTYADSSGYPTGKASISWSGCGEVYPLTTTDLNSSTDKHHCWSQGQGGFGDGIGLGDGEPGNWYFTGAMVNYNSSDGVDLLHGNGTGTIKFLRSISEGNAGQSFKSSVFTTYIENSALIGNCGFHYQQSFTSTKNAAGASWGFDTCRASGDTIAFTNKVVGSKMYVSNSTILSNGNVVFLTAGADGACDSTNKLYIYNNIIYGGREFNDDTSINGLGGNDTSDYYYAGGSNGNGLGSCGSLGIASTNDYNIVYATKNIASDTDCSGGAHNQCNVDPLFTGTIKQGPYTSPGYYTVTGYYGQLYLNASSTAIGSTSADETITMIGTANDINAYDRGAQWDVGMYEYGSVASTCSNGVQDGDETGVDCGGSCGACSGGGTTTTGSKGIRGYSILRGKSIYR